MKSYSLFDIDTYLFEHISIFKNRNPNGLYVECGAADGIQQSNTKMIEDENFGWHGILIEPNKKMFESCKKNRPNNICENIALVSNDYKCDTIEGDWDNPWPSPEAMMGGCTIKHKKTSQIPCFTFDALMTKYSVNKVDLFSLDVEGYELEVLKGINFQKTLISYIILECHFEMKETETKNYLLDNGFVIIHCFNDFIYLLKNKI